jgi:general secretion pathway protein G
VQPSITFWILILGIGVVAYALFVPRIGGGDHNRVVAAKVDIDGGIKTALDHYKIDNGYFPKNFNDLIQQPSGTINWHGPYLDTLPIDPWGNTNVYEFPGKHNPSSYDLMSVGRDGKKGTEDDIGNW